MNITDIMDIRDIIMTASDKTAPNAAILEAAGLRSLNVNQAMGKVRAALSKDGATSRDVYAVVVYGRHQAPSDFNYLTTVNVFLKAYWKGWRSLSRLNVGPSAKSYQLQKIRDRDSSDVCIYWGSSDAKDIQEKMSRSPGVYVIFSHLDDSLLERMELPPLPDRFKESPVVIQLKTTGYTAGRREGSKAWNPWNTLVRQVAVEDKAEQEIEKDTLDWRTEFMSDYECWTSTEVAEQSSSPAKNVSAIASRWVAEGKIFSIRFRGKTWFPRFQFQDGSPIPAVAAVIKAFPKQSTGWDLAFFFTNPNAYIAGRKPLEIMKSDPEKVKSLAQAFTSPADAF
jgi:hypothetical protein